MPTSKVRKINPFIGKIEPPPLDLNLSPPKPPIPVPAPVAQPPQSTVPPSDSVTTMEQYQEKLDNIKLKLSSMPRDRLQQNLAQFRTTLHGLDASINGGKVHPDRKTQLRLDRQILADVLKWSVELLESNPSLVPSASTSAIQSTAPTSSVSTLEQVRVRP